MEPVVFSMIQMASLLRRDVCTVYSTISFDLDVNRVVYTYSGFKSPGL